MTFPAVQARSYTTWPGPAPAFSHAIALPSSIVAGELLLVVALSRSGTVASMSASAGWTEVFDSTATGGTLAAYWKIAEGADTLTISMSGSERIAYNCWRIGGGKTVTAAAMTSGSSDYPSPPNHAPGAGVKDFLWIAAAGYLSTATTAYAAFPGGYTSTRNAPASTNGGADVTLLGVCEKTTTASNEAPGVFSGHVGAPSEWWVAQTLAVHPASKGGAIFMGAGL